MSVSLLLTRVEISRYEDKIFILLDFPFTKRSDRTQQNCVTVKSNMLLVLKFKTVIIVVFVITNPTWYCQHS